MPVTLAPRGLPGKREVRVALRRALDSAPLCTSPRLQRLLTFLVEEVLAGRGESLVQYRVATEGLELGDKFDPENSTLVRSHAGRLRKALAAYYEGEGSAEETVIVMPPSGYRVAFFRRGPSSERGISRLAGNLPLLVVSRFRAIGLQDRWENLPLSFTEELSCRLGCAAHLRVAQGERAACRPDADFVLEGSIEQRGSKILVRSRLLEALGGVQIWSRRYDFAADRWDPSVFEEEIIDAIAIEVGSDFGKIDRHLLRQIPANAGAQDLLSFALLKAKAYESSFSESAYEEAVVALRRALQESPANTTAHGVIAFLLLVGHCEYFRRQAPFPAESTEHLAIAQAAEPNNPYAHCGRVVELLVRHRYGAVGEVGRKLLDDTDFPAGLALPVCLYQMYARAADTETRERAARLMNQNPDYPRIIHTGFALEHLAAGNHEAAARDMSEAVVPGYWFGPVMDIAIHRAAGRDAEARAARVRLLELCPDYDRFGQEVLGRSLHPEFVELLTAAYRDVA